MTKRLTILFIALTWLLLGVNYWLSGGHWLVGNYIAALAIAFMPAVILAITVWRKGKIRPALINALICASAAAITVALTVFHHTETGRGIIWRAINHVSTNAHSSEE
jgi:hypothetical protein